VNEGSFLRLKTPENAVMAPSISVLLEHGTPSISVDIERVTRNLITDTGFSVSLMQPGIARSELRATHLKQQTVSFRIGTREF
jgi:hypothetical protein